MAKLRPSSRTLQLFGQRSSKQKEEGAGSLHIANSSRLGFTGNYTCSLGLESLRCCSELFGQRYSSEQTEEGAGSKHTANSSRLGFTGNSTCSLCLEILRCYSELIGAPQGTLDAFLFHGIGEPLHEENENSTLYDCLPEKKKLPVDCSTMRGVKRGSIWACINLSNMDEKVLLGFLNKLVGIYSVTTMDFFPVPKIIHLNSAKASDIENNLKAMQTLLTIMGGNGLIVILPEDASSDEKVKDICENLGIIYHCCFPEHADKISEEINKAVRNTPFDSLEEIRQVEDEEDDDSEKMEVCLDEIHNESGDDETQVGSNVTFEEETGETEGSEQLEEENTGEKEGSEQHEEEDTGESEGSEQLEEREEDRSEQLDSSDQQDMDGCDEDQPVKRRYVSSWACINFSGMNQEKTMWFLRMLRTTCVNIGMDLHEWPVMLRCEKSTRPTKIEKTVSDVHAGLSAVLADYAVKERPIGLLIVILPDKPESYDKIEELCESLGFAYQCCSSSDARTPSKQYLKNSAHKIEANILKCVDDLYLPIVHTAVPFLSEAPTFVFGGAINPYSSTTCVASVVGLMDWPAANRYKSLFATQSHNDVIIKDLQILLRNDVTEGQLGYTYENERNVIRMIYPKAQITFVVVTQRPREFPGSEIGEDCNLTKFSYSNVDEESNTLISYRVLHDDNHFTADKLNSLCESLCTRWIRWTYPQICMAPPALFAHRSALVAGDYLREREASTGREIG